jgi:DNA-binding response OmpR family regulator
VWGFDFAGQTRKVDLRIRNKRAGVGVEIETVWGIGYRFERTPH